MNTKGSFTGIFLCFLTLFTLTDCSTCQTNILEGDSLTFQLTDKQLKDNDRFTIKKDDKILVPKRNRKQDGPGIVKDKFLELQPVKLSDSGTYNVEVFDVNGIRIKSHSESVCVYAKIPKPRVNITCQDEKVDLRCDVEGGKDLSFSWYKNGKDLKKNVLNFSTNIEENKSKYTCTAQNPVNKNTSDPVEEACFKPATLFGFDLWIMVGILAGGGGLVLVLIIVLVTVACRACKRREKQQRDEEEFRLNYLNTSPPPGQQKSKQTARGQPAPPEPYDDVSAQEIPCQAEPRPRNQQRARPPPPPIDDEEEQPPPLPQPRKKAQVRKREGPM
ncbi:hypothetical protein PHYPO_G00038280 [Pangasianodon hypophthalmus]|uniref:Ig-like domain-containing protein n=1 Tax=Pangasianodon hypophthalmus TaxID=310915 RepID=A0A5N5MNR5_PANHP|nr:hypothetical protein PHYPO_G00038280 [Pangasianodon hypophthalmus]